MSSHGWDMEALHQQHHFTLVVDDFGIKYTDTKDVKHLIHILKENYPIVTVDWSGILYCGITLEWDYIQRTVTLSMPHYLHRVLHKYQHPAPVRPQHAPHPWRPIQYGQQPKAIPNDASQTVDSKTKKKFRNWWEVYFIMPE